MPDICGGGGVTETACYANGSRPPPPPKMQPDIQEDAVSPSAGRSAAAAAPSWSRETAARASLWL